MGYARGRVDVVGGHNEREAEWKTMGIIEYVFGAASFVPHGVCLAWRPDLIALHAISDTLIALAYFMIPASIITFIRRRNDLQPAHVRLAGLFFAFILACGVTHVMGLITLWYPAYGLEGLLKLGTAVVSMATAVMLWPLMPALLAIPSQADLREANHRLAEEVEAHQRTLSELRAVQRDLRQRFEDRTRALAIASERLEMALAGSTITVFEQDKDLKYLWIFNPVAGFPIDHFIGRDDHQTLPDITSAAVVPVKRRVLETGAAETVTVPFPMQDGTHWFELRVQPAAVGPERPGIVSVAVDITEKRTAEREMRLMMRELTHRSKNLLAIVQSVAWQTARTAESIDAFVDNFSARLVGLAQSHDLLVASAWRGVQLADLITAQLEHLSEEQMGRIKRSGPLLQLRPSTAQNVGMALHELVTNSIKYGALSTEAGHVAIEWIKIPDSDPRLITLTWKETEGPTVVVPDHQGFGRIILERLVPRALGGDVRLEFAPTGIVWTLTAPLKALQPDERETTAEGL